MSALAFPYPEPEYGTEPYYAALNEERLVMQRCSTCARLRWHPAPLCLDCGASEHEWTQLSGRGRVYTWTVVTHPVHPAAVERVPYVVVEVELVEQAGLRMVSNLVDCDPDSISFDAPVTVGFVAHPSGQRLPVFRLD
ncbi:MAG: Zn-ribbon domain-containing OB-fold protein [Gammaproteobacteria bacterium]